MELTNWQQLCDRGADLVLCLDFPGGRAAAGFAELASAVPVDARFLHIGQPGSGQPGSQVDSWVREVLETGRPVRAVLGYCAGAALATRVSDALAEAGATPGAVVLFEAVTVTDASLCAEFTSAVESSAEHLTADELDGARRWAEELLETYPDDLPRIAAGLADRYDQLMAGVAARLALAPFFQRELTKGFTAYLDYLLLAGQGGLDSRAATPVFVSTRDHDLPVDGARNVPFDVSPADLLRDTEVLKLVADLLKGTHPW